MTSSTHFLSLGDKGATDLTPEEKTQQEKRLPHPITIPSVQLRKLMMERTGETEKYDRRYFK